MTNKNGGGMINQPHKQQAEPEKTEVPEPYSADKLSKVTEDSARGGFFLFSGSTLALVIMAISAIVIGRLMGHALYGQYTLVLVLPSILLVFTDLGINAGITKFAASLHAEGKDESVARVVKHGIILMLLVGIVVFIVSMVFAKYLALIINRPDFTFYIQVASISIVFQVLFNSSTSAFVGLDRTEYAAIVNNVQAAVKTILQIVLVLLGFGITGALIGFTGGFIIGSALAGAILFLKLTKSSKNQDKESFGQTLNLLGRYGMPIYVSVLLAGLLPLYQRIVLSFFASDAAIGDYGAASNFIQLLSIIPGAITAALLPAFSKLDSSTAEKVSTFFRRANKYTCLLIVPTTALLILFSTQVVEIVYGSGWPLAPLFLIISSLPYFLVAIGYLGLTSLFNGLGKTRLTLRVALVNFILLIVLSPILAGLYGISGALFASLIAATVGTAYAAYIGKYQLKVQFDLKSVARIYADGGLSALPCLLLLYFSVLHGIALLLVGAILYLLIFITLMPLIKIVNQDELRALRRVTAKIPLLNLIAAPMLGYQERIIRK